eukprot:CAMPEP_0175138146 /NCGR_PEP_ID=MMETSP0087-20121206/10188_1 /TAXON_ID=136419 /ORGANISM="Unknown Unknown, Strain D1" /LENGTH=963 /DNA_ID=CAMNT_0016421019 /DNA_START=360 /DNA_END=3251 /DNA_ORIENTATION=+
MALFMLPLLLYIFTPSMIDKVNDKAVTRCLESLAEPAMQAISTSKEIIEYCWSTRIGAKAEDECHASWIKCGGSLSANTTLCVSQTICTNEVQIDYRSLLLTLGAVIVPVLIGMFIRSRSLNIAGKVTFWGTTSGIVVVFVAIIHGSISQTYVWEGGYEIYLCAILIGFLGFCFGYGVSRLLGLEVRFARTVSLETGIQNGPLAIAIATLTFSGCSEEVSTDFCIQDQALIFPYLYSVWVVIQSIILVFGVFRQSRADPPPKLPEKQSIIVQDGSSEHEGGLPRTALNVKVDGAKAELVITYDDSITTLYQSFTDAATKYPKTRCLGTRDGKKYVWQTYAEVQKKACDLGAGLSGLGCASGDFVGIMGKNCPDWVIAAEACNAYSLVTVPLYDTLGPDAVEYIVNQTGMRAVLCSQEHTQQLLALKDRCPTLSYVVQFEDVTDPTAETRLLIDQPLKEQNKEEGNEKEEEKSELPARTSDIKVVCYSDMYAAAAKAPVSVCPPKAEDLALICYTSGTTGNPKGVMLTHGNMVADMAAAITNGIDIGPSDCHISYLPLAHVFERIMIATAVARGAQVGFYSGDVRNLTEDICILKPTIFASVPRLLNRLHDKILEAVNKQKGYNFITQFPPPSFKKWMFHKGYAAKKKDLAINVFEHGFWDSSVFSNVAARLGGQVRLIVTGSAPIASDVLDFLRIAFSCPVIEGYGQTECAAACTVGNPHDLATGHVGAPLPCNMIKLEDIPDMAYLTTDAEGPRGEICIKGNNVFKGYYKMEDQTSETLDADGWLHTGDVGMWLPNGTLKIIDRKKNIFKLAQGEYVAPEKLEQVLATSELIAQIFVTGRSLESVLVAVVVPDEEVMLRKKHEAAGTKPPPPKSAVDTTPSQEFIDLCNAPETKAEVEAEIIKLGKEHGFKGFEFPKNIFIESVPFSDTNDLLTPTFKAKRPQLRSHYEKTIDKLYSDLATK